MCGLHDARGDLLWRMSDSFGQGPEPGPGKRWFFGIVLAAVPVGVGLLTLYYAIAYSKTADWFAFGLSILSAGTALHFHYFWAARPSAHTLRHVGTRVSLAVLVASLVFQLLAPFF